VDRAGLHLGDPHRQPVRAGHGLDVAAEATGLARVPGIDGDALLADGLEPQAVGLDDLAVEHHVRPALVAAVLQRLVQIRGLGLQHVDGLVEIAVGGGLGDAQAAADQRDVAALTEPHQREQGLLAAAQRPGAGAGTPGAAFVGEQPGQEGHQLAGHVEHGRIGDHVEPPSKMICGKTSSNGGSTPGQGPACPSACRTGRDFTPPSPASPLLILLRKPQCG
jgi:hypothetical protein